MWQAVTDAVGTSGRDALWDYPDLMPTSEDIDDPTALVARLQASARGEEPVADEFDEALARLLDGDDFSESPADADADADAAGDPDAAGDEPDEDDGPGGDRPV